EADFVGTGEFQRRLVVGAAQGGERDAVPAAMDEPVDMSGEQMADIAMAAEDVEQVLRVGKPCLVQRGYADLKWRVMHDDHGVFRAGELAVQPGEAVGA